MKIAHENTVVALDRQYFLSHPKRAARETEKMSRSDAVDALSIHPASVLAPVIAAVVPDVASELLTSLPDRLAAELLSEMSPSTAARLLKQTSENERRLLLKLLDQHIAAEIRRLLTYPPDSAGALMEAQVDYFRDDATVDATLDKLRQNRARATRSLFVVDEENRLSGRVSIQEIAIAPSGTRLCDIAQPVTTTVGPTSSREEVVEKLESYSLVDLPVVDIDGQLLGVIYNATLLHAIQEDATADIQRMVGASADERALSPPLFALRKRLPWLQINLLTAFLAAGVVGIFEDTIARFTALAVLLPVVAGQSGNAGAQALAVTMRGLVLREIGLRNWVTVTVKEVQVGFMNGLAVAATCGLGVFLWSGSLGLVMVIAISMVLAMVAAGFAGAVVPIVLTKLGQDPAQSSSIILTTVTDVAGFFSFLGIATILASSL